MRRFSEVYAIVHLLLDIVFCISHFCTSIYHFVKLDKIIKESLLYIVMLNLKWDYYIIPFTKYIIQNTKMKLGCALNLKIRNTNFKCRIQKPKWSHEIRLNDAIKRSVHSGALGAQFKLGRPSKTAF